MYMSELREKYLLPEIPARCADCRMVQLALAHIEEHDKDQEKLNEVGRAVIQGVPKELHEQLKEQILSQVGEEETSEEMTRAFTKFMAEETRNHVTEAMDYNDAHIEEERKNLVELLDGCPGELRARAKRGGASWIITICTSPSVVDKSAGVIADISLENE